MIIRKCDSCGKEINVFIKVQTTIGVAEGYFILGKKEKVNNDP